MLRRGEPDERRGHVVADDRVVAPAELLEQRSMAREQLRHLARQPVVAHDVHTEQVALRAARHARGAPDHLVVARARR